MSVRRRDVLLIALCLAMLAAIPYLVQTWWGVAVLATVTLYVVEIERWK